MSTPRSDLGSARRRLQTATQIARWLWCINAVVAVIGILTKHYELSALAIFTWALALIAAAIGRRAILMMPEAKERPPQLG